FEAAIENQVVVFIPLKPFDNSQALEILPYAHSLFDSAQADQPIEIRLGGGERKGTRVRYHPSPDSISSVVVPLIAYEVHKANFGPGIPIVSQHLLVNRLGREHLSKRNPSRRRIRWVKFQRATKMLEGDIESIRP